MKKGQIVTIDFVPAFFIFIAIAGGFIVTWGSIVNIIDETDMRNEMQREVMLASTVLVKSQGSPEDWNSSDVEVIGLSDGGDNVLNLGKIDEMMQIDYNTSRELMNIETDFYIEFNMTNGTAFTIPSGNETIYGESPEAADNVVVIIRYVIIDDTIGKMTMRLWS